MKITVSAPGKIHLMGEHAVVYGKPAVLAAVSQRMYVTVCSRQFAVDSKKENFLKELRKKDAFLNAICEIVENKYQTKLPDVSFSVSSTIPTGSGMGSSAAFAASTIGALMVFLKKPWDVSLINELTFVAEKHQHGNPSGGDNSVVCFGGLLWFRREFEFLKTFWLLPMKIPQSFPPIVLVDTGKPEESTGRMVEIVASSFPSRVNEFPFQGKRVSKSRKQRILEEIEEETKQVVLGIHDEDEDRFLTAIKKGEGLLEGLGVVCQKTKEFIRAIEKKGGVGKISGAGGIKAGSGIVLCMHKNPQEIKDIAKQFGFPLFSTLLGQPGVRVEKISV